jgi:hypothetical protein
MNFHPLLENRGAGGIHDSFQQDGEGDAECGW